MEGKKKRKKTIFIISILIIAFIIIYIAKVDSFWESKKEKSNIAIERAIIKSALECYALEGSFPPSIEYLQDNYGLIVNKDAYFYHYKVNASNILPDIKVVERWRDE